MKVSLQIFWKFDTPVILIQSKEIVPIDPTFEMLPFLDVQIVQDLFNIE